MRFPSPLATGAALKVVAPSGPFDAELLKLGLKVFNEYEVQVPGDLYGRRDGFFAGTFQARLRELQTALDCEQSAGILMARGGYGLSELIPHLDFEGFKRFPKLFIGFSDATALHLRLASLGIASLHAANGTTWGRANEGELAALKANLSGDACTELTELEVLSPGAARGPLVGGNLTVIFTEAASGQLNLPRGCILLLEDVTETSYRIDRMMNALLMGGHLDAVAGVVLGEFTDCSAGRFGVETSEVLRRRLEQLSVPSLAQLPVGHGERNWPLLLGADCELLSSSRSLTLRTP